MPEVSFLVGSRTYTLRCGDGQEERLRSTAADLAARIDALARQVKGADDRQLLVVAAIQLLDELADRKAKGGQSAPLREWAERTADRLESIAERLDELVEVPKS